VKPRHLRSMHDNLVGIAFCLLFGSSSVSAQVITADHFSNGAIDLPYRLFCPSGDDVGTPLPLVLALHGRSYSGTDNELQLSPLSSRIWVSELVQSGNPCFVLVPRLPPERRWEDDFGRLEPDGGAPFLDGVCDLLDSLQAHHPIDADRIYLSGVSLGTHGAWGMLARHPGRFAAALIIAGRLVWNPEHPPGGSSGIPGFSNGCSARAEDIEKRASTGSRYHYRAPDSADPRSPPPRTDPRTADDVEMH